MNNAVDHRVRKYSRCFLIMLCVVAFVSFDTIDDGPAYKFPFAKAGLTEEQAAAHLLSRFTYGATPGQVEEVTKQGLENWFEEQLKGIPDKVVEKRISEYEIVSMTNAEIVNTCRRNAQVLKMAMADGVISKDSTDKSKEKYREELKAYMEKNGLKSERELIRQFINQKIIRAVYSNNQLQEVMTDFWFNHFNVSFTKRLAAPFIPNYERDVIRPNAVGEFEKLLFATAQSPAMLFYLDNFSSSAEVEEEPGKPKKRAKGLNENYAREVMELHTLGVDGGYTQSDVTNAARVLTGWTVYPMGDQGYGAGIKKQIEKLGEEKMKARGFVHRGDFLFTPNRHDKTSKQVLGKTFPANGGYEEGVELLRMLAVHQSTAKFISKKLATRFVSENPSPALVDRMAKTFEQEKGNIQKVLITMVTSPEFWDRSALRSRTKSPMELVISSVRALNADIRQPYQLYTWMNRMGQQIYFYQAPTGFPDRDQYWINTGALLNRMNFGLALADGRIPGVSFDLLALNKNHEPGDANEALITYTKLLMPYRDTESTIKRLMPLLNAPDLQKKIDSAASRSDATPNATQDSLLVESERDMVRAKPEMTYDYKLSQVVGILLGSPEFQRR
jgi:uncharacterized protein (DUF1800 family)